MIKNINQLISHKKPLNRKEYIINNILLMIILTIIKLITIEISTSEAGQITTTIIIYLYCQYNLIHQRLQSMGKNAKNTPLWLLGLGIPGINIIIFLRLILTKEKL